MTTTPRITPRERLVLFALIQAYIASGEPVASLALARHFAEAGGMSAATIRNVMASLGEAGLLEQQHSSAGRIPTPLAFRLYVESLGTHALAPARAEGLGAERRPQLQPRHHRRLGPDGRGAAEPGWDKLRCRGDAVLLRDRGDGGGADLHQHPIAR